MHPFLNIQPGKRYRTIMVDPPWPVNWTSKATPKYALMPIAEIAQLPILEIAEENCRLFLWTTNEFLPEALPLVRLWGFRYKMTYTWCKSYGMGRTPLSATEFCVIATRGNPPNPGSKKGEPAILNWHHPTRKLPHSTKPQEIIKVFESFSQQPRIELFARQRREGWDGWGQEYPKSFVS